MSWRTESGTGLEHKKGSICAGAGTMDSAGALTAFGLDFETLTVSEVLPRGQKGNAEGSGDTYVSAVENVGEVDDIACVAGAHPTASGQAVCCNHPCRSSLHRDRPHAMFNIRALQTSRREASGIPVARWHRDLQWSLSIPPPLTTQPLIHLRQLDLIHLNITDGAVDGIIANAPKVRNLALVIRAHTSSRRSKPYA